MLVGLPLSCCKNNNVPFSPKDVMNERKVSLVTFELVRVNWLAVTVKKLNNVLLP